MPTDILLDENGDLAFEDGDFRIGESSLQHQKLLLTYQKGELRASPVSGVGLINFLNDDNLEDLGTEVQKQFEADGMKIRILDVFENGRLKIDANYD